MLVTPSVTLELVSREATTSTWRVLGSTTYAEKGNYSVIVLIQDISGGTTLMSKKTKFKVADGPLTDVTATTTLSAVAGTSTGTHVLATFTDANPFAPVEDFKPTVKWGGTLVATPTVSVELVSRSATESTWNVVGSAVYKKPGNYAVSVSVKDVDGSKLTSAGKVAYSVAALLMAEDSEMAAANVPLLTQTDLQPIVSAAIARWAAVGLDASAMAKLSQIQFVLADLSGSRLGEAVGNQIRLDRDAAGNGWFVDPTPASDEEYASPESSNQLHAVDSRVVDRIDLLTVVEHELGHIIGFDDLDALADNLMSSVLGSGIRRNPHFDRLDAVLASE